MRIDVAIVDTVPLGVDTPADLERARDTPEVPTMKPGTSTTMAKSTTNKIAFQGEPGANSASRLPRRLSGHGAAALPDLRGRLRRGTSGEAELAMIPIENSVAGRVADIHHLLPDSRLHIIGEHFLPIHYQLMALQGRHAREIKTVHSHIHALGQCRKIIRKLG